MDAADDCVESIATAKPGVLVNAPAIRPTILGVSISKIYLNKIPVKHAEPTINNVRIMSVLPLERKESKNPGPAWIPMVKMNNTNPIFPNSLGMITPK